MDLPMQMLSLAKEAYQQAYAPYSNHPVGACLLAEDGQLYSACNLEDVTFNSICAEAAAIAHMIRQGQREIKGVLVYVQGEKPCAPCGSCRQRIAEFAKSDAVVYLANDKGIVQQLTIAELLPCNYDLEVTVRS